MIPSAGLKTSPPLYPNLVALAAKEAPRFIGRGRWLMHDGMLYGPIQGHGQGHEPLKVGNSAIFNGYLFPHLQWGLAKDHVFLN